MIANGSTQSSLYGKCTCATIDGYISTGGSIVVGGGRADATV